MPYSEHLAERVRRQLSGRSDVEEKKMFGGLTFMVAGKMCCGVKGDELMVRVGPDLYEKALESPHAREMDFTGRPMSGFIFVSADGLTDDGELGAWVGHGVQFACSRKP